LVPKYPALCIKRTNNIAYKNKAVNPTYLISVFAGVIKADFGLTDGQWGMSYLIGTLGSGIVMVWAGILTDHFRVRRLGAVVLVALALACLAMATAPAAWALPFIIFALRLTGQGMTSHIAVVAMARWFVASRGRALAIASFGYAFGEALMPLFIVFMFDFVPWQMMWVSFACFLVLMIPILTRLLRLERTPQSVAQDSQSTGMLNKHWTRKDTLRHWLFWLMVPAILGPSAWITALFFQQVHLAESKGWTHASLVALFPIYTVVAIAATVTTGFLVDRFGSAKLIAYVALPMAVGFVILGQAETMFGGAIGLAFIAVGHGANATLPNACFVFLGDHLCCMGWRSARATLTFDALGKRKMHLRRHAGYGTAELAEPTTTMGADPTIAEHCDEARPAGLEWVRHHRDLCPCR